MTKFLAVLLTFLMVLNSISAYELVSTSYQRLLKHQNHGEKYYKRGDYKKAFENLSESARWGYKKSQYLLAFMFLKGQHVDQSLEIGMAWLGVANEANIEEWQLTFDTIYSKLSSEQKSTINNKTLNYISMYGLEAQNMICNKRIEVGHRKPEVKCQHSPNRKATPLYEIEYKISNH